MISRVYQLFFFLFFALPMFAGATVLPRTGGGGTGGITNSCNTGPIQCCNQVQQANENPLVSLLSVLGVLAGPITGLVGVSCSPVTVIGGGGNSCSSQPVCCTGNQFNGLINLGCSPINVNV